MGTILNANPVLHYSSAFLAGIGIKVLLDKFYISHPKRSIGFNWRYPPVTIAVLASLLLTAFYMLSTAPKFDEAVLYAQSFMSLKYLALTFIGMLITVIYQTKLYTQKPIFTAVLVGLSLIYIVFAISLGDIAPAYNVFMYLAASYFILAAYLLFDEYRQSKQLSITTENEDVTIQVNPELNSLEDFRKWFKDDSTIKSTEELEPDLQVYATRITERLQNGGGKDEKDLAQHIALCGPYGCGKSSIVAAIANELKKPKQVKLESSDKEKLRVKQQNKINWIHSDISTWGAASGSVAHVVLSNIIDDISQYIDMCAFRTLPKHYTEALKSGGGIFQFASTLLAGPIDIEQSFQKLNDVLDTTNHKLLITLQDVDRGTGDENEKRLNDIAALLDRLKDRDLSHINFIVAMGNEKPLYIEVISKATDYREDIAKSDFTDLLVNYIYANLTRSKVLSVIPYSWGSLDDVKNVPTKRIGFYLPERTELNKLISSFRILKKVLRRADEIWWDNNLKGEVNFISLLMMLALREVEPNLFSKYINFINSAKLKSEQTDIERFIEKDTPKEVKNYLSVMLGIKIKTVSIRDSNPLKERDIWLLNPNNEYLQTVGCSNEMSFYVQRILRQSIFSSEFKDQDVIRDILNLKKLSLLLFVEKWLSFDESKQEKYSQFIFLKFNEDQTLAYQELGSDNLPNELSSTTCRHVIKFVHYIAKNLTIKNIYEIFNGLLYVQDAREHSNALINYLGFNEKYIPIEIEPLIYKLNLDKNKGRYLLLCLKQSYKLYHAEKRLKDVSESEKFHCLGRMLDNSEYLRQPVLNSDSKLDNTPKIPNVTSLYTISYKTSVGVVEVK
ncbi:AAA family ATPase [Pseudoalteromonas sp. SWN29]|uniref:AAA family ATPase n=1 Tax=Pseudoalteromonas sp. SWN29 TaxID=2792064 RepID=UPI001E53E01E|nr:AAA family ATPase [Pseudoalteromonas sp. SWN29]